MSEVFLTFVITTASGICLAALAMCYKSRCSHIRFCGVDIERNSVLEERLDELALQQPHRGSIAS